MTARLLDPSLPACETGESPLWQAAGNTLCWVDIPGCSVYAYALETGVLQTVKTNAQPGFIVADAAGAIIAGLPDGLYEIDFSQKAASLRHKAEAPSGTRFNDAACDGRGCLWLGSMVLDKSRGIPAGALHRFYAGKLVTIEPNFYTSNGPVWDPEYKTLYHVDTTNGRIWRYDYDMQTASVSNRALFQAFEKDIHPDGIAVDGEGNLYVALYGGWGIDVFSAAGEKKNHIPLPVPNVTKAAFGGADMKKLFITTACKGMLGAQMSEAPLSGQVFVMDMDIAGLPASPFRANI